MTIGRAVATSHDTRGENRWEGGPRSDEGSRWRSSTTVGAAAISPIGDPGSELTKLAVRPRVSPGCRETGNTGLTWSSLFASPHDSHTFGVHPERGHLSERRSGFGPRTLPSQRWLRLGERAPPDPRSAHRRSAGRNGPPLPCAPRSGTRRRLPAARQASAKVAPPDALAWSAAGPRAVRNDDRRPEAHRLHALAGDVRSGREVDADVGVGEQSPQVHPRVDRDLAAEGPPSPG